jgi:hypothetical protein
MRHLLFVDESKVHYNVFVDPNGNGTLLYEYRNPNRHTIKRYIAHTPNRHISFMIKDDPQESALYVYEHGQVRKIYESDGDVPE